MVSKKTQNAFDNRLSLTILGNGGKNHFVYAH